MLLPINDRKLTIQPDSTVKTGWKNEVDENEDEDEERKKVNKIIQVVRAEESVMSSKKRGEKEAAIWSASK